MKTREALRQIRRIGGLLLRQRGSHKVFRLPDGRLVVIPHSGAHAEVSIGLARQLRRLELHPDQQGRGR